MSVLNQSGEEQVECPLCMEPLEVDDLNFFPCTCGYQICRFCWHRIRTDENGLCPACRKAYSEDPADFVPLSREQLAQLKAEKRARDQRRKAKLTEGRKHLASVRVVQRNLVFVVGLPMRLADAEILKRHEYFGKFGKIHKVVINQSTSYAGSQGPSASAYVTYMKSDDALRAIQAVNNIVIDGRLIKSSLGTTKYCSHFMKNQPCPKPDCMYLHEYGDSEASFTKEQMHAGKHQEYEKKLHDELNMRTKQNNSNTTNSNLTEDSKAANSIASNSSQKHSKEKDGLDKQQQQQHGGGSGKDSSGTNKENWPQLNLEKDKKEKDKSSKKGKTKDGKKERRDAGSKSNSESSGKSERSTASSSKIEVNKEEKSPSPPISEANSTPPPLPVDRQNTQKQIVVDDNSSFFSLNGFQKITQEEHAEATHDGTEESDNGSHAQSIFTDTLPDISTTEDWEVAFGFTRHHEPQNAEEMKRREAKGPLEAFGAGFGPFDGHEPAYSKDTFNGFYEPNKLQENLLDVLSHKTNGYGVRAEPHPPPPPNGLNGLDQNMSKFFTSFQEKMTAAAGGPPAYQNGYTYPGATAHGHMLLQQKQLEEHIMSLTLAAKGFPYQNGAHQPYLNGDAYGGHLYGGARQGGGGRSAEDELDFDPIQETQKAFEELMACEGARKGHSPAGRSNQMNGLIHSPTGGHLPPPPGFLQHNSHMNSFGSKFLPFLNMSAGQPQLNPSPNGWNNGYNVPQKNVTNTCNDWKVLDPAILSASSHHYPMGQAGGAPPQQQREHYGAPPPPPPQQQQRLHDYGAGPFPGFAAQLPPAFNAFGPQAWFGPEVGAAQISSPPGFRAGQTKQQEC